MYLVYLLYLLLYLAVPAVPVVHVYGSAVYPNPTKHNNTLPTPVPLVRLYKSRDLITYQFGKVGDLAGIEEETLRHQEPVGYACFLGVLETEGLVGADKLVLQTFNALITIKLQIS